MSDWFREFGFQEQIVKEESYLLAGVSPENAPLAWLYNSSNGQLESATGADVTQLESKAATLINCKRFSLGPSERVLQTGFDLQVHLRHPGQAQKETLAGGLASAFRGGFDAILTMPNTKPFLDTPEKLSEAIASLTEACPLQSAWPQVYFSAAGTVNMQGEAVSDIAGLAQAGAAAITDDGWGVKSDTAMAEIFRRCGENDIPFLQHAEMPGHGGHASPSAYQEKYKIPPYPRTAESKMVARDVALLKKAPQGTRYHVLHISTQETLAEIRKAKDAGLAVTCEVTPHHLYFANTDFPEPTATKEHTNFKMNPPIFAPEDREALQTALEEGLIDCVSTDHAPHEEEAKRDDWAYAAFGTRGLVTALPVLLSLWSDGRLSWERLIETYVFGGRRVLGSRASQKPTGFVIVDVEKNWTVTQKDLPGISRNSCFLGTELKGAIVARFAEGQFVRFK